MVMIICKFGDITKQCAIETVYASEVNKSSGRLALKKKVVSVEQSTSFKVDIREDI